MILLYYEWHLIAGWPLRCTLARITEQLLKDLVSWGSNGKCPKIDCFLRDASLRFVLPILEYCCALFRSAADTHLKLLDRAVGGARFQTGGVFECDIAHRRSVVVLCVLYKIRCKEIYPLYGAQPGPHELVRVTRGALLPHRYTHLIPRCRTSQYRRTFISISVYLWIDLTDHVFNGAGLAGFKSRAIAFPLAWSLSCSIHTIVSYLSLSLLSVYRLVLWGCGLLTDRV